MRPVVAVVALVAYGWALVTAADARHEAKPTQYETVVRYVEHNERVERVETPILDSMIDDWDELERQSDCLFEFLREHFGYEITLERVLYAGWWTDELGGACAVIGADDE